MGHAEAPRALVISGLEKTGEPLQRALAEVLSDRFVALGTPQRSKKSDGFVPDDGAEEEEDEEDNNWPLPPGFIMIYICPVDAKERPAIHRNLVSGPFPQSAQIIQPLILIRLILFACLSARQVFDELQYPNIAIDSPGTSQYPGLTAHSCKPLSSAIKP
jgi:hypothetical protein